jgi:MFS family permease
MNPRRTRRAGAGLLVALATVAFALGQIGWREPPRFDGAGYATLAAALALGQGYRSIDQPDRPAQVNFPPAYPLALAAVRLVAGPSNPAYHAFSLACSFAATLLTWLWFRRQMPRRAAFWLALALGVNWIWSRTAGEIQSEPLYLLLQAAALLLADRLPGSRGGRRLGLAVALGLLAGLALLARQVGLVLVGAVALHLAIGRAWGAAALATGLALAINLPWIAWQAGNPQKKQVAYFLDRSPLAVAAENALFYLRRLPDMLTGPFVEVATVFAPRFSQGATAGAAVATALLLGGLLLALRSGRKRLGAVVALGTLALLLVWPFTEAGRFLIPLVPMLLVGAVEILSAGLGRLGARRPRAVAAWLLLAAALPYSCYSLATGRSAAQRARHEPFDAACAWIATQGDAPGPLLTSYPGEAYLQTGRQGVVARADADAAGVEALIERHGVAYLLVAPERFAHPPDDLLIRYIEARPGRVALAFGDPASVAVYRVAPAVQSPSISSPRSSFR